MLFLLAPSHIQVSGHITTPEGKKVYSLGGKWNEFLDARKCDDEGNPLPGAETLHLWKVLPGNPGPLMLVHALAGTHISTAHHAM